MTLSRAPLFAAAALAAPALLALTPSTAAAQTRTVRVTVENLAPANGVSFAPLRVGFHNGTYDAFNTGVAGNPAIVSIAEGGSGSAWFPAFAAADPTATLGTVSSTPAAPLQPGVSATADFTIDTATNPFFTFAAMVVPSNDLFVSNDDPQEYRLFDAAGNLLINEIDQLGRDIWDANSEVAIVENGAFVQGGVNDNRVAENGTVAFDFSELSVFDGVTTAAGYTFNPQISPDGQISRITFSVVPEPASASLLGMSAAVGLLRRRR